MNIRNKAAAAILVALALASAACSSGGTEAAPADDVGQPVGGESADAGEDAAAPEDDDSPAEDYWSEGRLAGLEASKSDYEPPSPAPAVSTQEPVSTAPTREPVSTAPTEDPSQASRSSSGPPQSTDGPTDPSASTTRTIRGTVTVNEVHGPITALITGIPGQPIRELSGSQLDEYKTILDSLEDGATYSCEKGAGGGYKDLVPGGQVVVEDGDHSIVGTAVLEGGTFSMYGCTFDFSIDVPTTDYYTVKVTHRGGVTYSRSELDSSGWKVATTIG